MTVNDAVARRVAMLLKEKNMSLTEFLDDAIFDPQGLEIEQ